jgi:GNAT superfamily N-acetyltransferase
MSEIFLRNLAATDRPVIARLLRDSQVFRPSEIAIGLELFDETLMPGPSTDYRWIIAEKSAEMIGFACYGSVPLTEGTYDLFWITVKRGSVGVGSILERTVVDRLQSIGARWLIVETSSRPGFDRAHAFYLKRGYVLMTRMADYYRSSEDRCIYGKRLDVSQPDGI